jgi:hypothetical protein
MALTETKVIDKIEVVEYGVVQVREATRILKDGGQIAQTYHRWTLSPGQDVSDQADNVKAICQAAWTPEVILAYQKQQEENAKRLGA